MGTADSSLPSQPMGSTRTRIASNYALITPDTHVPSPLAGWTNAEAVVHIAPAIGARFLQYTASLEAGAKSASPGPGVSRLVFVLTGEISVAGVIQGDLSTGQYAYFAPDAEAQITCSSSATLAVFEKVYQDGDSSAPKSLLGDSSQVPGEPFQGDPDLRLQSLLPTTPDFDMAVNVFTYQPGGRLPQVEVHIMEHGLLMLDGEGVYRLGDDWFPVQAGDVIWMAAYCPQWFVAMGKQPARYLYYKDVNRDRLTD